jgi:hypothetical protein
LHDRSARIHAAVLCDQNPAEAIGFIFCAFNKFANARNITISSFFKVASLAPRVLEPQVGRFHENAGKLN